jgi:hypothetical protein
MFSSTSYLALVLASSAHYVLADLPMLTATDAAAYNAGKYGTQPNQTFHSTNLTAPRLLVNKWGKSATNTGSHIFLSPELSGALSGVTMILRADDLSLVYTDPSWDGGPNTMVQIYNNEPCLTFWAGVTTKGGGSGGGRILDSSYQLLANVTTQNLATAADSHEFGVTPDGGALFINYHNITADCTSVGGGSNCTLRTGAFQEVDIATGRPRFTWHAEDHFDVSESLVPWTGDDAVPWDWFHFNSLSKTPSGDYLISGRLLSMLALINGTTGEKIWQIGGKNNQFKDISVNSTATFAFPHHARFVERSQIGHTNNSFDEITMFDNHVLNLAGNASLSIPGCTGNCSRALRIRLDHRNKTFTLVNQFYHPESVQTFAGGSNQILSNKNVVVGWGTVPSFTEFTPTGKTLLDVQVGPWLASITGLDILYRVFKFDWVATPITKPDIVIVNGSVYVSWNGATEVASWALVSFVFPFLKSNFLLLLFRPVCKARANLNVVVWRPKEFFNG